MSSKIRIMQCRTVLALYSVQITGEDLHSYCTFSVCHWLMLFWSCDNLVSGSLTRDFLLLLFSPFFIVSYLLTSNNNNTIISSDKKRYEIIIRKSDDRKIRTLKRLHTLITRRTQRMNVFSLPQELRLQRETPLCRPRPPGLHRLSALVRLRPLRRSGGAGPHRTLLRPLPLPAHPLPKGQSDGGLVRLGGGAQSHQAADRKRRWSQTGVPELSGDLSYWASSALCRRQSAQLPGLQVRPLAQPRPHTHRYCCWFSFDAPVCVCVRLCVTALPLQTYLCSM